MRSTKQGFTLIELSIVLVIIGLIVGGVLVGRDLIRAAQVRQQVTQIEQFDAAVNTFNTKYNCLPGDCAKASSFGLGRVSTAWGFNVDGDGNGIVSCSPTPGNNCGGFYPDTLGENYNFWYHLFKAGLIPAYECTDESTCSNAYASGTGAFGVMTPRSKLDFNGTAAGSYNAGGVGIGWTGNYNPSSPAVYRISSTHMYVFAHFIVGAGTGGMFRPSDLNALDSKMDDGKPGSGKMLSYIIGTSQDINNGHSAWTPNTCTDNSDYFNTNGTPPTHYVANDNFECSGFMVKASF